MSRFSSVRELGAAFSPTAISCAAICLAAVAASSAFQTPPTGTPPAAATDSSKVKRNDRTSMVELFAHRDKYHGREVTTQGYLDSIAGESAIYFTQDDAENRLGANGLRVTFAAPTPEEDSAPKRRVIEGRFVELTGVFDKADPEGGARWEGAITNVRRIVPLHRDTTEVFDEYGKVPVLQGPSSEYSPSLTRLVSRIEDYHDRPVQIEGYLVVEFEGTAIYPTKDHGDYGMSADGLWVDFDRQKVKCDKGWGPTEFDGKYVLIEGTVDKNSRGHLGGWSGAIKNVDRILERRNSRRQAK